MSRHTLSQRKNPSPPEAGTTFCKGIIYFDIPLLQIFCPHLNTAQFERKAGAAEDFYKKLDFIIMDRLVKSGGRGALVAMPRWKSSSGARAEVAWAEQNNIPIFFPDSPGLESLTHIWNWFLDEKSPT